MMRSWSNHVRQAVFAKARKRLVNDLFYAKPLFAPGLVRMHQIMSNLEQVNMITSLSQSIAYGTEEFAECQQVSVGGGTVAVEGDDSSGESAGGLKIPEDAG